MFIVCVCLVRRTTPGSIWFQISENSLYIQNTLGVLFMTVALLSFVSFSSVPHYIEQRAIYNRLVGNTTHTTHAACGA
jgi:hypothetical protein